MASLTMMASFVGGVTAVKRPWNNHRRSLTVPKAQIQDSTKKTTNDNEDDNNINDHNNNGRRAVMFAAAAAAICAAGSRPAAMADEPKPGTPEAKKIYAPICVTMPTAKICHK
ncbi:Antimicrobial/protein inhibitor gamma-crystallin-like protein [Dioscorea alata]|uniref:Antimicrobial/protein inhibitor gamma-crystallin-like protein n=1 Tax=Dioscorea alata TaxID=55571 RepID=A0ACB7UXN6_DIOAL|nr:Antimicrobial/protein inhibitor gamma-crystallin-like protein [Dioscorea alata]